MRRRYGAAAFFGAGRGDSCSTDGGRASKDPDLRTSPALLLVVAISLPALGASPVDPHRSEQAQILIQDARRRLAMGTFDERRIAMEQLEQALRLTRDDIALRDELGNVYLDRGLFPLATTMFQSVLKRSHRDAQALYGLGRVSQRDWLESGEFVTLLQAIHRFEVTTKAHPELCDAWTTLAALRLEKGDTDRAFDAATSALVTSPDCNEAQLSAAYLAYRTGHVMLADSMFRTVLPRLAPAARARFDDISPLVTETQAQKMAALPPAARSEAVRQFWSESNPDPTDSINLARLEYWSRLAHATLLLGDPWGERWALRTRHYARYGRKVQIQHDLGPRHYEMPRIELGEVPELPTREALAHLAQVTTPDGIAIFAPLPPRTREIPMASRLAIFQGKTKPRVVAALQVAGTPRDSVTAQCVALDDNEHEVARESQALSGCACDPAELRTAEFQLDLPPGSYRIAFSVRSGNARATRSIVEDVTTAEPGLAMSDVVVTCGVPEVAPNTSSVRLDPDLAGEVKQGRPLFAYFEIYHLRTDAAGQNHFRYEYAIRDEPQKKRTRPLPSFSTTQEGSGPIRRQFIRVPIGSLEPGRYALVITVEDSISTETTEGRAYFDIR